MLARSAQAKSMMIASWASSVSSAGLARLAIDVHRDLLCDLFAAT